MDTLQILERLGQLNKTVEVTIYGGKGWYDKWIVKLQYNEEGTKVETEGRDPEFPLALSIAWNKLDRALIMGAAPHALIPPIEQAQLEPPIEPPAPESDEIPF